MQERAASCILKILVMSDSHSGMSFMRYCVDKLKPDHIIHLGDYYDDGRALAELYPHIRIHQVPGNGDCFGVGAREPLVLCYDIGGVRIFMTHGHKHGVKGGDGLLVSAAKAMQAQVALYGHTHEADCYKDENGMWVMNPGSCRGYSGTVGLVEIEDKKVTSCRLVGQEAFA